MAILPFLVGFGIYLGRVLRWNSWDILHNPFLLFSDVFEIITSPLENMEAWAFTILFGLFLKLVYRFYKIFLFRFISI
jgi:uncharacterized membrane protein